MRHLKDREAKQLTKEFMQTYPSSEHSLGSAKDFQELLSEEGSVIFVAGRPLILRSNNRLIPSLKFDEVLNSFPKITVDMGAVPHVVNGAHIMRPGIRQIAGDFGKGDLLAIVDEKFGKTIALGIAEMNSNSMRSIGKGRMITNLHCVGDKFWQSFSTKGTD